jgi:hypothetical protein
MAVGQSGAEEGQGTARPAICTDGVPAAEMACGVDPGTSILEGSKVLANWAMDINGTVGGGGSNKAKEVEDVIVTIAGVEGGGRAIMSAWGGRRKRCSRIPCPHPCLHCGRHWQGHDGKAVVVLIAVLVGRGVKLILISLNFLVLVAP